MVGYGAGYGVRSPFRTVSSIGWPHTSWGRRSRKTRQLDRETLYRAPCIRVRKESIKMGQKAYPKSTLKKIVKAHSNHTLKKNADVTVCSLSIACLFTWLTVR